MVTDSLERVIELVRSEQVALFIGAGFSLKAGAPSAGKLAEAFKAALPSDVREGLLGEQLDYLSGEIVEQNNGNRGELERILDEQFDFEVGDFADHLTLAKIPHFRRFFTTNYDNLLEKALEGRNVKVIVEDADCSQGGKYNAPELYKIHGDIAHKDKIVITRRDYDDFIAGKRDEFLYGAMMQAFVSSSVLFIGYSLNDSNIRQLIEHVTTKLGRSRREVFLLAPGLAQTNINYLQRNGIEYIDSTAEEFFKELMASIKDNIAEDFRSARVQTETFAEFCNNFGLSPKVQLDNGKRKLKGVDFDSNTVQESIEMTISGNKGVPDLTKLDFTKDGIVRNGDILPSVVIEASDIQEFKHIVNGITIISRNELEKVMLRPCIISKGMFTMKVPDISLLEQLPYICYRLNDHVMGVAIETSLYVLYITCDIRKIDDEVSESAKRIDGLGFTISFKEEYKSYEEANKWIDFLIAVTSGSEFIMNNLLGVGKMSEYPNQVALFKEHKEFYENVRKIELYRGEVFSVHQAFDRDNLDASRVILQILEGGKKRIPINKNGKITATLTIPLDEAKELCSTIDQQQVRQSATTLEDIIFNEINFGKITHIIEYPKMEFEGIEVLENEHIASFRPLTDYAWKMYELSSRQS